MDRAAAREVEAMIEAEFVRSASDVALPGRIVLVDGFNVLHAVLLAQDRQGGWWKREARERLLERVASWPAPSDELWVAFDGVRPAWSVWAEPVAIPQPRVSRPFGPERGSDAGAALGPLVHSVFVESADDWIVRRARRAPDPARLLVVTNDRQVAGRSRSAGAEVATPWAFMSRCPTGNAVEAEAAGA